MINVAPALNRRLMSKAFVNHETGCWELRRNINNSGYGLFHYQGKQVLAHRLSYKLFVDEIPEGMLICHRCDNPPCIRPSHLFVGTSADNTADMVAKGRHRQGSANAYKQSCSRGHVFSPENTTIRLNGKRECRTCNNARNMARYFALKVENANKEGEN